MNGSKNPLRTKARWIVDTHIYDRASSTDSTGQETDESKLFALVVEKCPEIYSSKEQHKELKPHLAKYRFPQRMPRFLLDLDERKKFRQLKNAPRPASEEEKEMFKKRGHDKITDDLHLYELARAAQAEVLVTRDKHQLEHPNREKIEAAFGVRLMRPEDLLLLAKEEADAEEARQKTEKETAFQEKEEWEEPDS